MELIVPDDQLSLAIGKKGQNVRLASQLTGWRIDIHSASKVLEMEARAAASRWRRSPASARRVAEALFKAGWRSAAEVAGAKPEELTSVPGLANARRRRRSSRPRGRRGEAERVRHAAEAARAAQQARRDAEAAASAAAASAEAAAAANPEAP